VFLPESLVDWLRETSRSCSFRKLCGGGLPGASGK
jgi:hypothetical protein